MIDVMLDGTEIPDGCIPERFTIRTLREAAAMLAELGDSAKLLAGGQSLIPLMKLRLANPGHLVDRNFIPDLSYIEEERGTLRFGPLTRHAEIEASPVAATIPIIHDCAAGIADVQVRNRGPIGGSLAEADPSGDWATVLMTLPTGVRCQNATLNRRVPLADFITDAYTTVLAPDELVAEVAVTVPPGSGGAYLACKRSAPVRRPPRPCNSPCKTASARTPRSHWVVSA
jgi:aerobic carbon-monoxide dehydrogenase medium subunit